MGPPELAWGAMDTVETKRCRVAWVKIAMFAKCALRAESRWMRPSQSSDRAENRLARWANCDRARLLRQELIEDARLRAKGVKTGAYL